MLFLEHAEVDGIVPSLFLLLLVLFFYMLKGMELPKSLPSLVSPLFLRAEGDGTIPVLSSTGQSSFFYLLKRMELPKFLPPLVIPLYFMVPAEDRWNCPSPFLYWSFLSFFYMLKGVELPKSLPPLVIPLFFTLPSDIIQARGRQRGPEGVKPMMEALLKYASWFEYYTYEP